MACVLLCNACKENRPSLTEQRVSAHSLIYSFLFLILIIIAGFGLDFEFRLELSLRLELG